MACSAAILFYGEEEDVQLAACALECLSRMSLQVVQSGLPVIVVEAPLVGEVETAVQLGVILVHGVAVRGRVVLQKSGIVALVQIDSVETRADAVPAAGMMLVQRPSQRSGCNQYDNQPAQARAMLHQEETGCRHNHYRQGPALR